MLKEQAKRKSGVSFEVDSVTLAERHLWTEDLAYSLTRRRIGRQILVLPEQQRQVINAPADELKQQWPDIDVQHIGSRCHPLIDAVHVAFSQHRPLKLSPDDIWLVIAQGFSHHVAENGTLRPRLVRHQGRQALTVKTR